MADELLTLEILCDELVEVYHFVQYRLVGLQGLLDGRYQNLVYAVGLDDLAFRISAVQEREFVETDFGGFLGKPFGTVHVLGRRHCHMKPACPTLFLRNGFHDLELATLVGSSADNRLVEVSFSVGQRYFIAGSKTEHTQAMAHFFFGHLYIGCDIGSIKYVHISVFNYSVIQLFRFPFPSVCGFRRATGRPIHILPFR